MTLQDIKTKTEAYVAGLTDTDWVWSGDRVLVVYEDEDINCPDVHLKIYLLTAL